MTRRLIIQQLLKKVIQVLRMKIQALRHHLFRDLYEQDDHLNGLEIKSILCQFKHFSPTGKSVFIYSKNNLKVNFKILYVLL